MIKFWIKSIKVNLFIKHKVQKLSYFSLRVAFPFPLIQVDFMPSLQIMKKRHKSQWIKKKGGMYGHDLFEVYKLKVESKKLIACYGRNKYVRKD